MCFVSSCHPITPVLQWLPCPPSLHSLQMMPMPSNKVMNGQLSPSADARNTSLCQSWSERRDASVSCRPEVPEVPACLAGRQPTVGRQVAVSFT